MQTVFYSELSSVQTEENGRETSIMPPVPGGTAPTIPMKERRFDASPWGEKYEISKNRDCFWVPKTGCRYPFFLGSFSGPSPPSDPSTPPRGPPGVLCTSTLRSAHCAVMLCFTVAKEKNIICKVSDAPRGRATKYTKHQKYEGKYEYSGITKTTHAHSHTPQIIRKGQNAGITTKNTSIREWGNRATRARRSTYARMGEPSYSRE